MKFALGHSTEANLPKKIVQKPPAAKNERGARGERGSHGKLKSAASPAQGSRTAQAPGEIRIIGGQYKRSKLPVANKPGLRPTPERVRETLFNWLGQDMGGMRCVDAFAGSGALGFEAASRGALDVLLVENDAQLVTALNTVKTRLKATAVRVQRGDALAVLNALPAASVQLVFIDPPFDAVVSATVSGAAAAMAAATPPAGPEPHSVFSASVAAAARAISAQGAVYLEAPRAWQDADVAACGLRVAKSGKAGAVYYHLLLKLQTL